MLQSIWRPIWRRFGWRLELLWHRARHSGARVLVAGAAALALVAAFASGYLLARDDLRGLRAGLAELAARFDLPGAGEATNERLAELELNARVLSGSNERLAAHLYERMGEIETLREQLHIYRSVVAPEDLDSDLSVFDVTLTPGDGASASAGANVWRAEVVLTKRRRDPEVAKGRMQVAVRGERRGAEVALDGLYEGETEFAFRYFIRMKGALTLPPGFTPKTLEIKASAKGFDTLEHAHAWHAPPRHAGAGAALGE